MSHHSFLIHDDTDDVGVAVTDLDPDQEVTGIYMDCGEAVSLTSRDSVPLGHKIALRDLGEGADVIKYGVRIGRTMADVKAGDYVHTHNLRTARW
ncbi:MAG: UxaA family hydrolase [Actinomycetota bacterium]